MNINIVLGLLGVRDEGLDEELAQNARDGLDLDILGGASFDPLLGFGPGFIQRKETGLSSSLDQLVGFGDEFGTGDQQPRVGNLSLV